MKNDKLVYLAIGIAIIFLIGNQFGLFATLPSGQFNSNSDCSFITNVDYGLNGEEGNDYQASGGWILLDRDGDGNKEPYKWIGTRGGSGGVCDGLRVILTTDAGVEVKEFILETFDLEQVYVCSEDGLFAEKYQDTPLTQDMINADSSCSGNPTLQIEDITLDSYSVSKTENEKELAFYFYWNGGVAPYSIEFDFGDGDIYSKDGIIFQNRRITNFYPIDGSYSGSICISDSDSSTLDYCGPLTIQVNGDEVSITQSPETTTDTPAIVAPEDTTVDPDISTGDIQSNLQIIWDKYQLWIIGFGGVLLLIILFKK